MSDKLPAMTVAELRLALADLPDHYQVVLEGCDCLGPCAAIALDDEAAEIALLRPLVMWDLGPFRMARGERDDVVFEVPLYRTGEYDEDDE